MDKNYTRQFQKEILKLHLSIAAFSSVFILLLSFWLDYFYNGAVIDFIQMIFGWNVAFFILKNQTVCVFIVLLVILLLNSLIVELFAIKKISHVFSQMKILFHTLRWRQLDQSYSQLLLRICETPSQTQSKQRADVEVKTILIPDY